MRKLPPLFTAIVLAGCASSAPPPSPVYGENYANSYENVQRRDRTVHSNIDKFLAGPQGDCQAESLDKALTIARRAEADANDLSTLQRTASWFLDAADAAASHGCPDRAKAIYHYVIATYIGSGYAAHRQRAEIGLADLRALGS
jgi:hypothetical protein